mmetsp:Transcript_29434/g.77395  ORF Transcript_29434/g.77395 Transcript_29434/m.77395 type:complete len:283 (+) Transcript_29434:263-1111(+)
MRHMFMVQDFRTSLIKGGYAERIDSPELEKQEKRELRKMEPRPYLSVFGVVILFFAMACLLYPLCELMEAIGLPGAPCLLIVTAGAAFFAICNACFYLFLIWSCTRFVASLIFLLIAVSGSILLPAGNPILVMFWILISFGSWYMYFFYAPSLYDEGERPWWLQDIGKHSLMENNAQIDAEVGKFSKALRTGGEALAEDINESIEAARKKAEQMAEAARKQAEEAAEYAKKQAEAAAEAAKKQAEAAAEAAKKQAEAAAAAAQPKAEEKKPEEAKTTKMGVI